MILLNKCLEAVEELASLHAEQDCRDGYLAASAFRREIEEALENAQA